MQFASISIGRTREADAKCRAEDDSARTLNPRSCAMRVLLADDHRDSVEALAACFALARFDLVASDGAEATIKALALE